MTGVIAPVVDADRAILNMYIDVFGAGNELYSFSGLSVVPLGGLSFFTQRFFQLRPEGSPAPADFSGPDLAVCDALQIGRAGNFKILAGLFGGENVILTDSVFDYTRPTITILPAVAAVAAVGFFALFFFSAALRIAFAYHTCFSHFQPCVIKFGNILILGHKAVFFIIVVFFITEAGFEYNVISSTNLL
jgi:hypothetical protein